MNILQLLKQVDAKFPQKDGKHHCVYRPSDPPAPEGVALALLMHVHEQTQVVNLHEEDLEKDTTVLFDEIIQLVMPSMSDKPQETP